MALVVFLRGVNVGGHRTFRPSILARSLSAYGVVNVGAAGTFVVRKPGSKAKFRAALLRKLPFEAEVVLCDGRDLIRLEIENPFGAELVRRDIVRFVSILSKAGGLRLSIGYSRIERCRGVPARLQTDSLSPGGSDRDHRREQPPPRMAAFGAMQRGIWP